MILPDNETKVDLLNNEAIARTIIDILRAQPDYPLTIGVHGDWGAGKSSILEMIDYGLEGPEEVVCLKFNGWRFQGFEDAKIALMEGIVSELLEQRPTLRKAGDAVKDVFRRIDWLKVAKSSGGLALTALTGVPSPEIVSAATSVIQRVASDPSTLMEEENRTEASEALHTFLREKENTPKVPEEVEEFRKAFDTLLDRAEIDQLVVLIDDLDRCLPDVAIETLEAIRLFVFTPRTAFVVAADEAMIEYAVRKHFPDLPESTGPRDYARNYLEKLIQVPFRIPPLGETETRIYILLLLAGNDPDSADRYQQLIDLAKERLKRPWKGEVLDAELVSAALGGLSTPIQNALTLSEQIGPMLTRGSRGNPRQIKRFLNALLLRLQAARARGFGDDLNIAVLAKFMIAEQFVPRFFEQVAAKAATDPDGKVKELEALEAFARQAGAVEDGKGPDEGEGEEGEGSDPDSGSPLLDEWEAAEEVLEWARIEPEIASVDLRPYLFIAKDRKDYFGSRSALGHLAVVVDQLMGSQLAVQATAADLAELTPTEAGKVLKAIRARLIASGAFAEQPAGIAGITELVKAQPALQPQLLDLLESLPADQLGPWAVQGWRAVVTDETQKARLGALLKSWSEDESADVMLKTAAGAALQTLKAQRG